MGYGRRMLVACPSAKSASPPAHSSAWPLCDRYCYVDALVLLLLLPDVVMARIELQLRLEQIWGCFKQARYAISNKMTSTS